MTSLTLEQEEKKFHTIKHLADIELSNSLCYLDEDYFFRMCKNPDLSVSRVLFSLIKKDIAEINSKTKSRRTLLRNMKYSAKYLTSSVFDGMQIPAVQIEKLIK
jgi:hypothetical protein